MQFEDKMAPTTLQEERREVWISILESLRSAPEDTDRSAACRHLLRHLVDSGYKFTGTDSSKMFCGN